MYVRALLPDNGIFLFFQSVCRKFVWEQRIRPGSLCRADQKTFQHSPARTDKTIFIMLHSFCRAYEKAGIFLAFIILQTDDEALLGINIKKVFI